MGSLISSNLHPKQVVENLRHLVTGRKRKRDDSDNEEEVSKVIDIVMHTSKRKKLVTTAKYIYQALFEEGRNSDIIVEAFGHEFHLHKIYLSQSPYFASMFGGSWLEANKNHIIIELIDPEITYDSLKTVLGSLYNDEVTLNPSDVVSILATATMLQLDGIIEKCREVMTETINPQSVMRYYEAASRYGDKSLYRSCKKWFLINLMTFYYYGPLSNLRTIPLSLMAELVKNADLFVIQTEFSLYVMLKFWMYTHLHPDLQSDPFIKEINTFYMTRTDDTAFLCTEEGKKFVPVFKGLRVHNLISHNVDVETIQRDNIIPRAWFYPAILKQWKVMLKVNQNEDKGPCLESINSLFMMKSLRCGRILAEKDRHMWRWTGFHYGMDLLMITDGSSLSVKRNHRPEFEQLLSFQASRGLTIRVVVATLNEQRQVVYMQNSGIRNFSLAKGEEIPVMVFDKRIKFPLIISANILFTSTDNANSAVEAPVEVVA